MHVLVALQNVWSLVEDVVEELRHEKGCPLILLSRHVHLVLKLYVVTLEELILTLGSLELFLDLLEFVLKEIDEVLVGLVVGNQRGIATIALPLCLAAHNGRSVLILLALKVLNLLLQPFDDLLAEVTSLSKFLLYLLVNLNVSLHGINLSLHLAILVQ